MIEDACIRIDGVYNIALMLLDQRSAVYDVQVDDPSQ